MVVYRVLSILLFPFLELYLFYRVYKKKEDKKRLRERFGQATQPRLKGDLIWLHAVSVGETNSALIFVDKLLIKFPEAQILFTTTTLTSAETIATKLPEFHGRVTHQFLPIDSYFCVREFLDFWQPSKVFFVESEIWPNLIFESVKMGAKIFLVNARISEKSAKRWSLAHTFGFDIFNNFDVIFAQSEEDKNRLAKFTTKEVLFYGNLKSQARGLGFNQKELDKLKAQIGTRKFWVAASTHKGEEEMVIQTHFELKKYFPDLLTILIPRHQNRSEEIKMLFGGIDFAQRSKKQDIAHSTEVYLADTLGELGTFYFLANFTFLGGSLMPVGGHNPFEPIKLNCAVVNGPHVFNFKEVYENLRQKDACTFVESTEELTKKVKYFLENEDAVKSMIDRALHSIQEPENIAGKILEKIT